MRKFTTLFLLALAMTIGANQAFAASAVGGQSNNSRGGQSNPESSDGDGERHMREAFEIDDLVAVICTEDAPCIRWPRRPIKIKKKTEDCSCVHKVMRVNGRFMPFIDCYNTVEINGRDQLRYCRK